MKKPQNAICSNCGWIDSDALGMVNCPICGAEIIPLETEELEKTEGKQEKYPTDTVSKLEKEEIDPITDET